MHSAEQNKLFVDNQVDVQHIDHTQLNLNKESDTDNEQSFKDKMSTKVVGATTKPHYS